MKRVTEVLMTCPDLSINLSVIEKESFIGIALNTRLTATVSGTINSLVSVSVSLSIVLSW